MRRALLTGILLLTFTAAGATPLRAQVPSSAPRATAPAGALPTIEERTSGWRKLDGYFPLYWKVLMVQPNFSFRSSSDNPAERHSVEDSFAKSVLWGFTVTAESGGRAVRIGCVLRPLDRYRHLLE